MYIYRHISTSCCQFELAAQETELNIVTDVNGKMTFTNSYEEFINLKNKAKEEGVIP